MWGFPKIRGTFLGVPIIRIIVFWGLYWGSLILGNYHVGSRFVRHLRMPQVASSCIWVWSWQAPLGKMQLRDLEGMV